MMGMREIFLVSGGLGLFLFGMKMMSGGLELVAGDRLQGILKKATSNRFLGVVVGIVATIAINSSTATTIMTVSFVNSGMMNLTQAIGIIMGANVGTTFSAQMIAFRLDTFAPLFIFIGAVLYIFFKKTRVKNVGYIVLGFGVLFFGVSVMGGPFKELAQQPAFNAFLTAFGNPFLSLLAGFAFTAIIQSSSATTGILVTLHLSGVPIPFETSAFIILGTNIGTSITTVIASIPANRESKRAALFHITYDIIGSAVFGTLIYVFPGILGWFTSTWGEPARQVAMFHTLYNLATMFLLLPFVKYLARLMERIVPKQAKAADETYARRLLYLGSSLTGTPSMEIINARREIIRLGKIVNEQYRLSAGAFFGSNGNVFEEKRRNRDLIDYLKRNIRRKLAKLSRMGLKRQDAIQIDALDGVLRDIDRIDDRARKITRNKNKMNENGFAFSAITMDELKMLSDVVDGILAESLGVYENGDKAGLPKIKSQVKMAKGLKAACVESRIERLADRDFDAAKNEMFYDLLNCFVKSAERARKIAFSIATDKYDGDE